jgi:paraquat-inducible protein B
MSDKQKSDPREGEPFQRPNRSLLIWVVVVLALVIIGVAMWANVANRGETDEKPGVLPATSTSDLL